MTTFIKTSTGDFYSTDEKWHVSFGLGCMHPDHPRIWSLYERTGEYLKGEGEILRHILGDFFTAEEAMAAADQTDEERVAAWRKARAELLEIVTAQRAEYDRKHAL